MWAIATDAKNTIRDAILTFAQTLTRVSLIYRTEPTTKMWKTEKLIVIKQMFVEQNVS